MKRRSKAGKPRKSKPRATVRQYPVWNSGKMPRTLIQDASTGAAAYNDLVMVAQAQHNLTPCYARTVQRLARQLKEGLTATQAIAAWTEKPVPAITLTEVVLHEVVLSERQPDGFM